MGKIIVNKWTCAATFFFGTVLLILGIVVVGGDTLDAAAENLLVLNHYVDRLAHAALDVIR